MARKGRKTRPSAPSGLTKEMALEEIKEMLNNAKADIKDVGVMSSFGVANPFSVRVYTHINDDGSVDGELRLSNIDEQVSLREVIAMIAEDRIRPIKDFWSAMGIRFGDPEGENLKDKYTRYKGMNQVSTYFARMGQDRMRINYQFATLQNITDHMSEANRPRAMQIYVKIHWNKMNRKPQKRYDRRVKED